MLASMSKYSSTPIFSLKSRLENPTSSNLNHPLPSPHQQSSTHMPGEAAKQKNGKLSKAIKIFASNTNKNAPEHQTYHPVSPQNQNSFNKKEILKHVQPRFKYKKQEGPAPNAYRVTDNHRRSNPKFTINQSDRSLTIQNSHYSPAPNAYNPTQTHQEKSLAFSVGKSNRNTLRVRNSNPGPGTYSSEKTFLSVSFNQKERNFPQAPRIMNFGGRDEAPGPGAYSKTSAITDYIPKNRGFTLQKRVSAAQLETPGPGHYNSQSLRHKFSSYDGPKLPQSQRRLFVTLQAKRASAIPGPGSHQIGNHTFKHKLSKSINFSHQKLPHFSRSQEKMDSNHKSMPKFAMLHNKRRDIYENEINRNLPQCFLDGKHDSINPTEGRNYKIQRIDRLKAINKSKISAGAYNPQANDLSRQKKHHKEDRATFFEKVLKTKLTPFPQPPSPQSNYSSHHPTKRLQINEKKISKL